MPPPPPRPLQASSPPVIAVDPKVVPDALRALRATTEATAVDISALVPAIRNLPSFQSLSLGSIPDSSIVAFVNVFLATPKLSSDYDVLSLTVTVPPADPRSIIESSSIGPSVTNGVASSAGVSGSFPVGAINQSSNGQLSSLLSVSRDAVVKKLWVFPREIVSEKLIVKIILTARRPLRLLEIHNLAQRTIRPDVPQHITESIVQSLVKCGFVVLKTINGFELYELNVVTSFAQYSVFNSQLMSQFPDPVKAILKSAKDMKAVDASALHVFSAVRVDDHTGQIDCVRFITPDEWMDFVTLCLGAVSPGTAIPLDQFTSACVAEFSRKPWQSVDGSPVELVIDQIMFNCPSLMMTVSGSRLFVHAPFAAEPSVTASLWPSQPSDQPSWRYFASLPRITIDGQLCVKVVRGWTDAVDSDHANAVVSIPLEESRVLSIPPSLSEVLSDPLVDSETTARSQIDIFYECLNDIERAVLSDFGTELLLRVDLSKAKRMPFVLASIRFLLLTNGFIDCSISCKLEQGSKIKTSLRARFPCYFPSFVQASRLLRSGEESIGESVSAEDVKVAEREMLDRFNELVSVSVLARMSTILSSPLPQSSVSVTSARPRSSPSRGSVTGVDNDSLL
jgi:hypothetical protein